MYYAWLAHRLAKKTGRTDVCALQSGISVPHMFVVTFVIMLPIFVVAGVFIFVITLLLLFSALRCSFGQSFGIALIPLALTLICVFGFRQGKPPAYDRDLVDYWTNGAGFGPNPQTQPKHPLKDTDPADHVAN